jgi:hypothetical protein
MGERAPWDLAQRMLALLAQAAVVAAEVARAAQDLMRVPW